MNLQDEQNMDIDLALELTTKERIPHFGLNGQATNIFPVTSTKPECKVDLIAKVFWVEELRMSEPDILRKAYEIAEKNVDVKGHVPDMVYYQSFSEMSTAKIQERLGINTNGSCILYAIIFRKLNPITDLIGNELLHTWWATVKCHLALWQNGVHHRDVSPSNLMHWYEDGKSMGVLNDFDLASLEDGPTGTKRTGTVPFMALVLLKADGLAGKIKHQYQHDAESFIWVLTWITLRYAEGRLRAKGDRPLEDCLKMDASTCRIKRADFLFLKTWRGMTGALGHEQNYEVAKACLDVLLITIVSKPSSLDEVLPVDTAFQKLLYDPVAPFLVLENNN